VGIFSRWLSRFFLGWVAAVLGLFLVGGLIFLGFVVWGVDLLAGDGKLDGLPRMGSG
jgi:hypothetical protein